MAKPRTAYVCAECGAESPKWQGQCPDCNAWNSYSEVRLAVAKPAARASYAGKAAGAPAVTPLAAVAGEFEQRTPVGIAEFDRVLGGGLVTGSVVLVGGGDGLQAGRSLLVRASLRSVSL